MIFTPAQQSRIKANPAYLPFVSGLRARFTNPGWIKQLPNRGSDTVYAAAVVKWHDPTWPIPPVVDQVIEKLAATWQTMAEKDLTKTTMPDLAEAYWLLMESISDDSLADVTRRVELYQIIARWLQLKQRGISPGSALYARVMGWRALACEDEARDCALHGFDAADGNHHPGIREWFGTDKWLFECGIMRPSCPSYWLMTTWGFMMALLTDYGAELRTLDGSVTTEQRRSAFQALPLNLLMADGKTARGGDDFREPAKLPTIAAGFIGNWGAAFRWYRSKMLTASGGPLRLRDLMWGGVGDVAAGVPRVATADFILCDDDGALLFERSMKGRRAKWYRSPFSNIFTDGHSWDHPFPMVETIESDGTRTAAYG